MDLLNNGPLLLAAATGQNSFDTLIVRLRLNLYRQIIDSYLRNDLEKAFQLQKYYYLTFLFNANVFFQAQHSFKLPSLTSSHSSACNDSSSSSHSSAHRQTCVSSQASLSLETYFPILTNILSNLASTSQQEATSSNSESLESYSESSQANFSHIEDEEDEEEVEVQEVKEELTDTQRRKGCRLESTSEENKELNFDRKTQSLFHLTCHYGELASTPKKEILFKSKCDACDDEKFCDFKSPHFHYIILYKTKRYDMFMACYKKLGSKKSSRLNRYSNEAIRQLICQFGMKKYNQK